MKKKHSSASKDTPQAPKTASSPTFLAIDQGIEVRAERLVMRNEPSNSLRALDEPLPRRQLPQHPDIAARSGTSETQGAAGSG